jgi:hypothetical protein
MFASLLAVSSPAGGGGWIGNWSPGIGDPNFVGWLTVVGYLLASFACWRTYRQLGEADGTTPAASAARRQTVGTPALAFVLALFGAHRRLLALPDRDRLRTLWLGLASVLLLLGINKQLDLQTALTELGRMASKRFGWYAIRRPVQLAFIFAVALLGLATYRAVLLLARGHVRSMRAVLAGTLFLICFVTIRAASFHHIDRLLGRDIGGFRLNWVVELGGIAFIIAGAVRARRAKPSEAA